MPKNRENQDDTQIKRSAPILFKKTIEALFYDCPILKLSAETESDAQ